MKRVSILIGMLMGFTVFVWIPKMNRLQIVETVPNISQSFGNIETYNTEITNSLQQIKEELNER